MKVGFEWKDTIDKLIGKMGRQRMNTKKQCNEEDDDKIYPHEATGFPSNEAAEPENWFEVHNNMEIQAKHTRQYPDVNVGDKSQSV